jgi:hypothetical protein
MDRALGFGPRGCGFESCRARKEKLNTPYFPAWYYVRMRKDKDFVFELRRAGKSYREIQKLTGVSLGTLAMWLKEHEWSRDIGKKLVFQHLERGTVRLIELNKIRGKRLDALYEAGRKLAAKEYQILKANPLFVAGVVAYWGEGDKVTRHLCRISSSDPAMVALFWTFLRKLCHIPSEKIACGLILYPDQDEEEVKGRWVERTGIPRANFKKATFIQGRHPIKKNPYGVCAIYISSRFLKEKMLVWLKLISKEFNAGMV